MTNEEIVKQIQGGFNHDTLQRYKYHAFTSMVEYQAIKSITMKEGIDNY